ncbi:MAG TPA: hypothetical protein VH640_28615 [Bryobacteraceae bacterium]|jgi:hypothetical protein
MAALPVRAEAAELQPATLKAYDSYLREVALHLEQRATNHQPFLWTDESPDRAARVRRGEVVVAPAVGRGTESIPNGLIHDWIGAIFIPNATTESLMAVLHDYDNYKELYRPAVRASQSLACTSDGQEFLMVWQRHVLFVNAAMQGHYQEHDVVVDSHRGYSVSDAAEIRQIEDYGHPDQHLLPPDTGSGFMWRIHSIARYEERDGGVYLELQAIALTRDIPASLSWLVRPAVNRLSINSLSATLRQTRDAVHGQFRAAALREPRLLQ